MHVRRKLDFGRQSDAPAGKAVRSDCSRQAEGAAPPTVFVTSWPSSGKSLAITLFPESAARYLASKNFSRITPLDP